MKLLLATDDSQFSEAALQTLISQNRPQQTQVRVLHVMEPIGIVLSELASEPPPGLYPAEPFELERLRKEQKKRASKLVESRAEELKDAGFQVETAIGEGDPRVEIIDMVSEWGADLIVMGSHGRKGLDRFLLGSVSEYVARHAPCSVEIVRLPAGARRASP
jgi:nucleotide-binding universal stress UspA family protein